MKWLAKQSINAAVGDRFPEGESCNRLDNSAIVNLLVKTNEGEGGREAESLVLYGRERGGRDRKLNFVACSASIVIRVGGGCIRHKVLFRAGWKHVFCMPGFENVSPEDRSDWVKETHCVVKV